MLAAAAQHHRLRDPALIAQPLLGVRGQFGDGILGEEVGADAFVGGFPSDGLGAVLAEFGGVPVPSGSGQRSSGNRSRPFCSAPTRLRRLRGGLPAANFIVSTIA